MIVLTRRLLIRLRTSAVIMVATSRFCMSFQRIRNMPLGTCAKHENRRNTQVDRQVEGQADRPKLGEQAWHIQIVTRSNHLCEIYLATPHQSIANTKPSTWSG